MVCLFCLKETNDGVTIYGRSELAEHARNIITKHFWFDVNEIDLAEAYACSNCWSKVESFHEFYVNVETNYHQKFHHNDGKMFGNPLLDCEPESIPIIDESSVKVEVHQFDTPEYESVFVPSTSYWDDSNKQVNDSLTDEVNLVPTKPNRTSESVSTIKQEVVTASQYTSAAVSKRKRESKIQDTKSAVGRRKYKVKTKLKLKKPKAIDKRKKEFRKDTRTVEEIVCYLCHKSFKTFRGVRKHFHVHDPAESYIYECDICGRKYSRIHVLKMHMRYHELRKNNDKSMAKWRIKTTCPICQKELKTGSLKLHILSMHENKKPIVHKTHMCEICGKGFSAPSLLAQHTLSHVDRSITEIQCEICGKWVKNKNMMRKHKATHKSNPQKCPHCDKIKMTSIALSNHIRFAHTEPKHPCTFCDKSFRRAKLLREHIATHTGESLYSCLYCSQQFKNDSNKYKHMREKHLAQWNLDRAKK